MSIKQLSDDLIKKIAAGEVIERPASVVKELVENSVDAKASRIEIEIKRSGRYIRVQDDGLGIHSDDISLLFVKHATSKITSFDDLWSLHTLGFRGEALASISSVSKVTCSSKNLSEDCGFEIKLLDGNIEKKSSGISKGTIFEVDDLFFNVPARKQFLKSEQTEVGHVYDVVIAQALSHPEIAFRLKHNDTVLLETSGSKDLEQTIIECLGNDLRNNLIEVKSHNRSVNLSGKISVLEVFRSTRKMIFTFVNSRPVKCQILNKAITNAYEDLLPPGKYPVLVLNLDFKPNCVDVNVHPTKKEVRYENSSEVYNLVLNTIRDAISDYYKSVYKEKSPLKLSASEKTIDDLNEWAKSSPTEYKIQENYTQAAFDLFEPLNVSEPEKNKSQNPVSSSFNDDSKFHLFTVSNLRSYISSFATPLSNMTKIGNKTIFEIGYIYSNKQIIFSGEIVGDDKTQKEFFILLATFSETIYKLQEPTSVIQSKIMHKTLDEDSKSTISNRKKPSLNILYKIWNRDNWTCVYCEKPLIDPETVKTAIKECEGGFKTYINSNGEEVTKHILKDYAATYDHHMPASKLPQFNYEEENLFASCIECNSKKSNSMDLTTWTPVRKNAWSKDLEVENLLFIDSKTFKIKEKSKKYD